MCLERALYHVEVYETVSANGKSINQIGPNHKVKTYNNSEKTQQSVEPL